MSLANQPILIKKNSNTNIMRMQIINQKQLDLRLDKYQPRCKNGPATLFLLKPMFVHVHKAYGFLRIHKLLF
jgi:hypothetical protein